jgi:hypothetical protein
VEAITLTHFDGEYTEALTDNYLKLRVRGQQKPNVSVRIHVESEIVETLVGAIAANVIS